MFARSSQGAAACSVVDRAASCSSAVQAHRFSPKAERSSHAVETAVPAGHTAPAVQAVESYEHGQMLPESGLPSAQVVTHVPA